MEDKVLTLRALRYKLSLAPGTRKCHNEAAHLQVRCFCLYLLISLGSPYFKIEACSFHTSFFLNIPEKVGVMVWKMFFYILFREPWGKSWLKRMGDYDIKESWKLSLRCRFVTLCFSLYFRSVKSRSVCLDSKRYFSDISCRFPCKSFSRIKAAFFLSI